MMQIYPFFIFLLSKGWSILSAISRQMVRWRVIRPIQIDARVISVGNIQAGGSGKTPLVAKIAQEAMDRHLIVCILCRGYKGLWEKTGGVIMPGEVGVDVEECGDEAALLHELVPQAWIGVGAFRVLSYQKVLKMAQVKIDCVLLDDGFQNHQFQKNLEIVAITSARPSQVVFREDQRALKNADLMIWTKGKVIPDFQGRPWAQVQYDLPIAKTTELFWLVTGVADGKSVHALSLQAGYRILKHLEFPDHAFYDRPCVESLLRQSAAQGCKIALTGKDWVKWKKWGIAQSLVCVLEPQLIWIHGQETWNRILWG